MEIPLFCERITGQWEKKIKASWRHVRTSAVDSWLWWGSQPAGPLPHRPGLGWAHCGEGLGREVSPHTQMKACSSQTSAVHAKKSSPKFYYKTEQWQNISLHVTIYIICKICYSFNLWTEISCFFSFFFSVLFASFICIFTWSCNLEKNACDDFKALSLPSSCN